MVNDAGAARHMQSPRGSGLALYVHIPFCESKCPYCDFNTYAGIEALMPPYVAALAREVEQWGAWLGRPTLASVFFGGGTPSYLPPNDLRRLMDAVRSAFDLQDDAEATAEANPGDCTPERLLAMRRAGFNRISIGVQSFDDAELAMLGRRHDAERAAQAVRDARKAGFDNLSLDLMFGLPEQSVATWARSVEEAIRLQTDHLSAYALTLESGTPLEADVRFGRTPEPDPDLAADMYLRAQTVLAAAGLQQYEISNWAAPGRESTHNLAYWRGRPYLGVGPGAHSYLYGVGALDGVRRAVRQRQPASAYTSSASMRGRFPASPLRGEADAQRRVRVNPCLVIPAKAGIQGPARPTVRGVVQVARLQGMPSRSSTLTPSLPLPRPATASPSAAATRWPRR